MEKGSISGYEIISIFVSSATFHKLRKLMATVMIRMKTILKLTDARDNND